MAQLAAARFPCELGPAPHEGCSEPKGCSHPVNAIPWGWDGDRDRLSHAGDALPSLRAWHFHAGAHRWACSCTLRQGFKRTEPCGHTAGDSTVGPQGDSSSQSRAVSPIQALVSPGSFDPSASGMGKHLKTAQGCSEPRDKAEQGEGGEHPTLAAPARGSHSAAGVLQAAGREVWGPAGTTSPRFDVADGGASITLGTKTTRPGCSSLALLRAVTCPELLPCVSSSSPEIHNKLENSLWPPLACRRMQHPPYLPAAEALPHPPSLTLSSFWQPQFPNFVALRNALGGSKRAHLKELFGGNMGHGHGPCAGLRTDPDPKPAPAG